MAAELTVPGKPQAADRTRPRSLLGVIWHRLTYPFRRGQRPAPQPPAGFYTDTTVCIGCKACEVACKQWNQLPADGFEFTGNSYDNTGALSAESWRHVKFVEQFATEIAKGSGASGSPLPLGEGPGVNLESLTPNQEPLAPNPSPRGRGEPGAPGPTPAARHPLEMIAMPAAAPDFSRWLMMSDVCKHCVAAPCQQACPTGAILYNEFANVYIQADICNGCAYCICACPFGVITRSHFDGHAHKCTLCYDRQRDGLVPACAKACPTASIQFGPVDELRERARARVEKLKEKGIPAYLYGDAPTDSYSPLHSFYLLIDRPEVYGLPPRPVNPWLNMRGDYLRTIAVGLAGLGIVLAAVLSGV